MSSGQLIVLSDRVFVGYRHLFLLWTIEWLVAQHQTFSTFEGVEGRAGLRLFVRRHFSISDGARLCQQSR